MIWLNNSRILAVFAVVLLHTSAAVVIDNKVGCGYWLAKIFLSSQPFE